MNMKTDPELADLHATYRARAAKLAYENVRRRPYRELYKLALHLQKAKRIDRETAIASIRIAEAGLRKPRSRGEPEDFGKALKNAADLLDQLVRLDVIGAPDPVCMTLATIQDFIFEALPSGLWPGGKPMSTSEVQTRVVDALIGELEVEREDDHESYVESFVPPLSNARVTTVAAALRDSGAPLPDQTLTPFNAPRDLARLRDVTAFRLRLLLTELGGLKTEEQKMTWHACATDEARAQFVYQALVAWDRTNGPSHGASH